MNTTFFVDSALSVDDGVTVDSACFSAVVSPVTHLLPSVDVEKGPEIITPTQDDFDLGQQSPTMKSFS
jgi:hypothetical protein